MVRAAASHPANRWGNFSPGQDQGHISVMRCSLMLPGASLRRGGWRLGALEACRVWLSWRKEAGLPGKWDLSLQQQQEACPWGGKRGTRPQRHPRPPGPGHIFHPPPPPPRPCPAFPVNTRTSSWGGPASGGGGGGSGGARPVSCELHTMAGPVAAAIIPHPRPSLGPGERPHLVIARQSKAVLTARCAFLEGACW